MKVPSCYEDTLLYEHPRGKTNREKIIRAIMHLGSPTEPQIKKFLDDEVVKFVKTMHQDTLSSSEEKKIKELEITDRTVYSWLRRLTREGLQTRKQQVFVNR